MTAEEAEEAEEEAAAEAAEAEEGDRGADQRRTRGDRMPQARSTTRRSRRCSA